MSCVKIKPKASKPSAQRLLKRFKALAKPSLCTCQEPRRHAFKAYVFELRPGIERAVLGSLLKFLLADVPLRFRV